MSRLSQLAAPLMSKYHLSKDEAETFVSLMFEVLNDGLHHEKLVKVKGLGTFKVTSVAPRESIDVNTGKRITIGGRDKITFVPDTTLRDRVNSPFAQFDTVVVNEGVDFSPIDEKYHTNALEDDADKTLPETSAPESENDTVEPEGDDIKPENSVVDPPKNDVVELESIVVEPPGNDAAEPENDAEDNVVEDIEPAPEAQTETKETTSADEMEGKSPTTEQLIESENETEVLGETAISSATTILQNATDNGDEGENDEKEPIAESLGRPTTATSDSEENAQTDVEELSTQLQTTRRWLKIMAAVLLFLIIGGVVGGYLLNREFELKNNRIAHLEAERQKLVIKSTPVRAKAVSPTPTNAAAKPVDDGSTPSQNAAKSASKPVLQKEEKVSAQEVKSPQADGRAAQEQAIQSPYDKDSRVRTGAYRIDGVAQTVTVSKGQTLSSISKAYLGSGMECYVEALNGCSEVKEGDRLKIPKLSLKKKKKK